MNTILAAGLFAALPLLAAPVSPTVDSPEVWRQALALLRPIVSEVSLSARYMPGGAWFNVDDHGLGIHLTGSHATDGVVKFSGRAGAALAFEARPLDSDQRPYGYQFVSKSLSARVVRFGDGFTLNGRAGGKPLALTLRRGALPDRYDIDGRDGTRLQAWITPSYADLHGRFDPERMTPEGLAVLGAAVALMFANTGIVQP